MLRLVLALLGAILLPTNLSAGDIPTAVQPLVLIVDASGSMNEKPRGVPKIKEAKDVVRVLLKDFPEDVPIGLIVFGHRRSRDCSDIEIVEKINRSDRARLDRISSMIMGLDARGETPIAAALEQSIPLFDGKPGRIVLVTDGREECGGDVCAAAMKLAASGIALKVDIVGFGLTDEQKASLECVTETTGGHYYDAKDAASLQDALNKATNSATGRALLEVTVIEGSAGKAASPMVRVRNTSGTETALTENPALFRIPAGDYQVTARVGTGTESSPMRVSLSEGETTAVTIRVGTGTLVATVTKGAGLSFKQRPMVQLWRRGEAAPVAGLSESKATFQAQAGEYTVRVGLSSGETKEFPGVVIAPGETTAKTLEVPAGELEVTVTGGKYAPRTNPYPYIEVRQNGRMVTALSDNPARFQLLAGKYTIAVTENGNVIVSKEIDVGAGDDINLPLQTP